MEVEKIIPIEDHESYFLEGMPDNVTSNIITYAYPKDRFLQAEIEYNGFNHE